MDMIYPTIILLIILVVCLHLLSLFMRTRSYRLQYVREARRLKRHLDKLEYLSKTKASIAAKKDSKSKDSFFSQIKH